MCLILKVKVACLVFFNTLYNLKKSMAIKLRTIQEFPGQYCNIILIIYRAISRVDEKDNSSTEYNTIAIMPR